MQAEACRFDPAVHLQLEAPAYIKTLTDRSTGSVDKVAFPVPLGTHESGGVAWPFNGHGGAPVPFDGLAFSAPFRVLSDEGVRAMREAIYNNERFAQTTDRAPKVLRGLGYRSSFIRDFTYSPQVLEHLSHMSGNPVHPHDMPLNIAHVNFGEIGNEQPVDEWHLDSVPYVMVVLLSDATDMQGGNLQVARLGDAKETLKKIAIDGIDMKDVDVVNYPGPGYAIFMQGSRIAHGVTPVSSAREPRLTLVNSYQSRNPFAEDRTKYRTFASWDPDDAAPSEYARHIAWRVQGRLDYLIKKGLFGQRNDILSILDGASTELRTAHDLITGKTADESPYVVDKHIDKAKKEDTRSRL
jgi:hypothetical protein